MSAAVDVVLPCLDEAAALPGVLAGLPREAGYRAVVVDNGSSDGSAAVAARSGATVVHEPQRGYGAAVHAGLLQATSEIVCVADCDGSIDLAELPALVEPVRRGSADLAVGRRMPVQREAFPWHARAGNAVLAAVLRRRGVQVRDLGPVRVGWRVDLLGLQVTDRGFGYPLEVLARAGRAGWRVREFPVTYHMRSAGTQSKVTGSALGTARAVRDMLGVLR
ncbi:glycosyltransferase family 2 protein [Saccharopolyspora aridisoli]|uniref:Glycosyltransferase family 2 protein n=1 Tax=Saccharopolyspora aridisoli TaxID=2530385 RepID=A0A4R4V1L8_9PSEU|nr:glycosyltransferase family 2 protein [Saccharopolyspora aridisoli]TDC95514.1 glycosyltransferase family 2 protein [Saccharopolyspora aridisoli]